MISFRIFEEADIPFGMALKAQAGWNQLEADWRRFLALEPSGCFVASLGGETAGTVTTCRFGPRVGWIGMLLVEEGHRRRGLGTALLHQAVAHLREQQVETIRLDASELGRPLYEQHGFATCYRVFRFQGNLRVPASAPPVVPTDQQALFALDRDVTAVPRETLLGRLLETPENVAQVNGGFALVRPGSNAWQLGPFIARDEAAARTLLTWAAHRLQGARVFLDVPEPNALGQGLAAEMGMQPARTFWRMDLGPPLSERLTAYFAGSGPEKG
jgi:GNAT superfamily N-acetyltransferase